MNEDELPPVLGEAFRRAFDNIFRAPDVRADNQEEEEDGHYFKPREIKSR